MTDYQIAPTDDGEFNVLQVRPVRIAAFTDKALAERFVAMMLLDEARQDLAPRPAERDMDFAAGITEAIVGKDRVRKAPESAESAAAPAEETADAEEEAEADRASAPSSLAEYRSDWTDPELEEAFARISAGEGVRDVADSFGKSWMALRGKWANHKRHQAAAIDNHEMEECRMCGKPFRPTPQRMDLCARCDR